MTTTVKVHVGGRYVAHVTQTDFTSHKAGTVETNTVTTRTTDVHGDYMDSPNPTGDYYFHVGHPAETTLAIHEEYLGEPKADPIPEPRSPSDPAGAPDLP